MTDYFDNFAIATRDAVTIITDYEQPLFTSRPFNGTVNQTDDDVIEEIYQDLNNSMYDRPCRNSVAKA